MNDRLLATETLKPLRGIIIIGSHGSRQNACPIYLVQRKYAINPSITREFGDKLCERLHVAANRPEEQTSSFKRLGIPLAGHGSGNGAWHLAIRSHGP